MTKFKYWLAFWTCIAGIVLAAVLTFIGAWKFGETSDDKLIIPYLPAVPLNIISTIVLVLLIVRKKPIVNKRRQDSKA